jgi:glycerol-3-phosphate cytidylyltransferase
LQASIYKNKDFTGKDTCLKRGIEIIYNKRDHGFSSTELRSRVWEVEHLKSLELIEKKFNKS